MYEGKLTSHLCVLVPYWHGIFVRDCFFGEADFLDDGGITDHYGMVVKETIVLICIYNREKWR